MDIRRIALIYDHTRAECIGHGCLRALLDLGEVDHFHPRDLERIQDDRSDLYVHVDDGWNYGWRDDLRPCAYWAIETPTNFSRCLKRAENADWVFCAQRDGAEALMRAGISNVEWLPLACDPLTYRPHVVEKLWDVCFVGRLFGRDRQALLQQLVAAVPSTHVSRTYGEEAARTYSASRIVFNCSTSGDINARVFEATACGSLLITDALDGNGLNELFRHGVHIATYNTAEELLQKVRHYLDHEDERERIAKAGRRELLSRHTFAHRMGRLLEVVQERPACRTAVLMSREIEDPEGTEPGVPKEDRVTRPADARELPTDITPVNDPQPCLSLCMIVRNAQRTLRECLASIRPWVDEMIVVDTGSVDDTCHIAAEFGAQLHHFTWCDDFSAARNESLRQAHGRWRFWMDADDTISADNGRRLRELAVSTHDEGLWAYVVQVHCPGRKEDGPDGVTVVDHVKLLRNRPEIHFEGRIHEQVLSSIRRSGGQVAWTDVFVVHSGSDLSAEGQAAKIERDLRILLQELTERPDHPFTLFNLGMTYSELRAFDTAARYLRRSLAVADARESHVRKAYALLVHCYAQNGQLDEAWNALREGLGHYPADVELHFREGLLYQMAGDFPAAEQAYWRVLTANEQRHFASIDRGIVSYKARQNLAQLYRDRGELAKSELQWRQITQEHSHYPRAWEGLIDALVAQGKVVEANQLTGRLADDPSTRVVGLLLHGKLAQAFGDITVAKQDWERAAAECTEDLEPLRCLCQLAFTSGTVEEAKGLLESLNARDPSDAAARHNLGLVYLRLNRPADALKAFRDSLQLRPRWGATLVHLGIALDQMGERSEARGIWQQVLQQDPHGISGQEARRRLAEAPGASAPAA
jgi:tetratricopeptide (TPR) repeat protein